MQQQQQSMKQDQNQTVKVTDQRSVLDSSRHGVMKAH